jgi:hypothetical protein
MKTSLMNTSMARGLVAALTLTIAQLAHAHAYPTHQVPSAGSAVTTS